MTSDDFLSSLSQRLASVSGHTLLRVFPATRKSEPIELTGAELVERSLGLAWKYCEAPPAGVVLLLLPHSPELFLLQLGLCLLGRLPAILPWPTSRVDPEKYQRNLLHQLQNLPAAQLLTLPALAQNLDPGLPYKVTPCPIEEHKRFEATFSMELDVARVEKQSSPVGGNDLPPDALFLQFSGGTTGDQKCIVVTSEMLAKQLDRLSAALQLNQDDGIVSWLPMYHDMGLIACFWLPLWNGLCSTQFAATEWLMNPGVLFHLMHKYRGTFSWLPNFAFSYLAAQKERMGPVEDLSHVRAWINCSEPVRAGSFDSFLAAFSNWGVRREQCQASYAMAENVFAVTQTPLGIPPAIVNRQSIEGGTSDGEPVAYALLDDRYVSSGPTLPGTAIRIMAKDAGVRDDVKAGEIQILGESLFCGYWGKSGFQKQCMTTDGWYATGDFGFLLGNELFVIGRTKDIVIVGGVNILPDEIETLVNSVAGLYPGRVVAFGVDDQVQGTESLAVVAEMRGEYENSAAAELELQIRRIVSSVLGTAPRYVRVVPERWIVKSTAGKISRTETRKRFLREMENSSLPNLVRTNR